MICKSHDILTPRDHKLLMNLILCLRIFTVGHSAKNQTHGNGNQSQEISDPCAKIKCYAIIF